MIYLDNNASTLMLPDVRLRMEEVLSMRLANPASQHSPGRRARLLLENARDSIAASVDAHLQSVNSDLVLFTSGGTEANNLAILGLPQKPGAIVVSAIEHPSVLAAAEHAKSLGRVVRLLPVDSSGVARMDLLEEWIADHRAHPNAPDRQIALVSLMIANNETGVLQPILPAAALCRSAGIPIHADGVQALGKGPLSFKALGVDALTLSAHKIHGPVGIGALILRHPFQLTPQMWGGFQQFGMRPGSEPVALAVGFAEAVQQAFASRAQRVASMETHRDRFESALQSQLPWIHILGKEVARLPNTSSVVFPGCDRQSLQMAFDLRGLACSTGSACASGSSQPSHVLQAMGLPEAWVQGGLRFSNSFETTEEEVDRAVQIIVETTRHLHQG